MIPQDDMTASRWDQAKDNPINWSVRIGRMFGIDIRLHIVFILWGVFEGLHRIGVAREAGWSGYAAVAAAVGIPALTFFFILLHEFGHCFGSRSLGGEADEILLWPLGGLATVSPPSTPRAHFLTALAGPAVNAVFCLLAGAVLAIGHGSVLAIPLNPFHPLTPLSGSSPAGWVWFTVTLIFAINYLLLTFNLALPMQPFDGGRMIHAWLWKRMGWARATLTTSTVGMIAAVGLGLIALLTQNLLLLGVAVFGYLTCYQQRQAARHGMLDSERFFGYDFSGGFGAFEEAARGESRPASGFFARRRAARLARIREREIREAQRREQEFDRILEKISKEGMGSLTSRERNFLARETQRRREV